MTLETGVKALAEAVAADVKEINLKSGDLSQLTTTANSNLVEAINEAAASGGGGAGLTLFEESRSVAAPNATVPVHALTALGAETNMDFVIAPKGTGALSLQVPDGTAAGGNKRGGSAVDLQTSRGSASQVASGNYALVAGQRNTASGESAVALGYQNTASGSVSFAAGYNCIATDPGAFAFGQNCEASGEGSIAIGNAVTARGVAGAMAEGFSSTKGAQQMERIPLRSDTTDATALQLTTTAFAYVRPTNSATMPNNSAYYCRLRVLARNTSTNESMGWSGTALIKRGANAAATTLVGSSIASDFGDAAMAGCTVELSADTTRGALAVIVTGLASTTIRWVAQLETVEAA